MIRTRPQFVKQSGTVKEEPMTPETKTVMTQDLKTDDATPLSSRMNWPLLSERKPSFDLHKYSATPLSDMLNWPLLSQKQGSSTELRTGDPTPFSSRFNWPLLSARKTDVELKTDTPTPFSDALGLPLLSDQTTVAGGRLSAPSGSADGPFGKFIRQIMTGEPQN